MPFLNAVFPLRWPLFACYSFRCWAFSGSLHITTHTAIGQFELDYYIELLKMWSICLCCSAGLAIASAMVCKQAVAGRASKKAERIPTLYETYVKLMTTATKISLDRHQQGRNYIKHTDRFNAFDRNLFLLHFTFTNLNLLERNMGFLHFAVVFVVATN